MPADVRNRRPADLDNGSLFAHLAYNFAPHPENLAVEALGHILRNSHAATSALARLLARIGSPPSGPLTFRTQVAAEDGTRPDLVGFDSRGRETVFIEAKFWVGLTDQQPVGYLRRLPAQDGATLLFLVPSARIATIWPKILNRAGDAGFELAEEEGTGDGNTNVARVDGHTRLAICSWDTLLGEMLADAEGLGELAASADIRQLNGLCRRMDGEGFHPFKGSDMGPDVPRMIIQLNELAGDIVQALELRGEADRVGLRPAGSIGGYRQYVRIRGTLMWIGIELKPWGRLAETPLWLGTQQSAFAQFTELQSEFADLEQARPPGVFIDGEVARFPLDLPLGLEKQEVLDAVVGQVLDICSRFNNIAGDRARS